MPAALLDPESADQVIKAIDEIVSDIGVPVILIVIDTVARNFGTGDENSTKDMGMFIQGIDALRVRHQAAILLVHHTGHGDKSRGRGSMALKGALDAEYKLARGDDGISVWNAPSARIMHHRLLWRSD
jgi:RecA-family ATPase